MDVEPTDLHVACLKSTGLDRLLILEKAAWRLLGLSEDPGLLPGFDPRDLVALLAFIGRPLGMTQRPEFRLAISRTSGPVPSAPSRTHSAP